MVVWELKSPGDLLTGTGKRWARKVISLLNQRRISDPPEPEAPPQEGLLTPEEFKRKKEQGIVVAQGGGVEKERYTRGNYTADLDAPRDKED